MPKYEYCCTNCDIHVDIVHSFSETVENCDECLMNGSLKRVPSMTTFLSTASKESRSERKTGSIVEEHIESNREQLKKEKERLKKVEYK